MTEVITVVSTVASADEAQRLARTLVEERLAACVNIVPGVQSIYRWQLSVESSSELLLLIKTRAGLWSALRDRLLELHSYEVPEAIVVNVPAGSQEYLNWVLTSTREV